MLPWIPTRYPMTHFFTKYIHIHYINALNEPPVHYLDKKLNPPVSAWYQLDIENFMTSSFYDVTPFLLPLITQIGQTFDYHSIINNMFHCKRLNIMHGLLDHGLIWPIHLNDFFWQIDTPGFKKVSKWYFHLRGDNLVNKLLKMCKKLKCKMIDRLD